jgi:pseudouridine-5'-monophosphatase
LPPLYHCAATRTAAAHLLSFFPEIPLTVDDFLGQREAKYVSRWETVQPLPGAVKLVTHLHAHGIPIALATSEQRMRYEDKTKHLQHLFSCFGDRVVCGDDYPGVMWGRPRPDIFLLAARDKLGMKVGEPDDNCSDEEQAVRAKGLVFEDAIAGFQGAKRAGMSGGKFPSSPASGSATEMHLQ